MNIDIYIYNYIFTYLYNNKNNNNNNYIKSIIIIMIIYFFYLPAFLGTSINQSSGTSSLFLVWS